MSISLNPHPSLADAMFPAGRNMIAFARTRITAACFIPSSLPADHRPFMLSARSERMCSPAALRHDWWKMGIQERCHTVTFCPCCRLEYKKS